MREFICDVGLHKENGFELNLIPNSRDTAMIGWMETFLFEGILFPEMWIITSLILGGGGGVCETE